MFGLVRVKTAEARIADAEAQRDMAVESRARAWREVQKCGQRAKGLRTELHNAEARIKRADRGVVELADNVRSLLANKATKLHPGAVVHDGNHLEGCDACDVFRLANKLGEERGADWFRLVRAGARQALPGRRQA